MWNEGALILASWTGINRQEGQRGNVAILISDDQKHSLFSSTKVSSIHVKMKTQTTAFNH